MNYINYCDNCRIACSEKVCPNCGKKKLRAVEDEDYCFVIEESNSLTAYFGNLLKEKDVEYVIMPWFSALDTHLALTAPSGRLFVRFKDFETARQVIEDYYKEITENLRKHLLDNFEKFNIYFPIEKKARKKLKIRDDIDIFDYCGDIIEEAETIKDTGCLDGLEGGHVIAVLTDSAKLFINSATYNIIDLGKR